METLPSGLHKNVADNEDLARFLTSTSQFNAKMAKPSAFLPSADQETSTFRHGSEPRALLWSIGDKEAAGERNIHAAAICKTDDVRALSLNVEAEEPPPRHAGIRGWPWDESDPEKHKARLKEIAGLIASKAVLIKR